MTGPDLPSPAAHGGQSGARGGRFSRLWLTRTSLAFWMIVVGALGASVAFWIARTEQRSVAMHRQLTRGQMIELSLRQAIVGDWSFRAALEARQREHGARVDALQDNATRVRPVDQALAGQFDMQAQQERMLSRLTGTLLVPFRDMAAGPDVRARVDLQVADELSRLGFSKSSLPEGSSEAGPSVVADAPADATRAPTFESVVTARELPVWRPFSEEIHHLHHHVPRLALGVVLFVLSLVCLTSADLFSRSPRVANAALLLGGVTASGAVVAVLAWDLSAWRPLLVAGVFAVVLGMIFRATGTFAHSADGETAHPPEFEPRHFGGVHVTLKHAAHLREQIMLGLVAVTVLLSSVVGWWFAEAQTHANESTHRAFATEVQINNLDAERWLDASANLITPTLELFHARMRCAYATQLAALPPDGFSQNTQAVYARDRERDCGALTTTENKAKAEVVERVDFDSAGYPGTALFAEVRNRGPFNPASLYALGDGYISEAELWERKAVTYVLGLTLFAISLYLLGQAMGMGEGAASSVLAVCGSLLALGTFGYAATAYWRPVMPEMTLSESCQTEGAAVEVAAMYYGRGRALLDMATTGADYQKAADAFGCALEARPGFGRAQYDRARAASLISQGDADSSYTNFPTRSRVAEIRASQAETLREFERSHWTPTPRLLNGHGFNTILAALIDANLPLLDEAIAALERAIVGSGIGTPEGVIDAVKLKAAPAAELDVNQMLYTNLGLARLARGERESAMKAYHAAVDGLRLSENRALVAGTLSDLNILESHCVTLHGDGSATCGVVAAGIKDARRLLLVGRTSSPRANGPTLTNLEAWARASRVGWTAKLAGFDGSADALAIVWSAYSDEWKTWRVVQPLLNRLESKQLATLNYPQQTSLYTAGPSYCLPEGRYRAEFYLNGERVETERSIEMDIRGFKDYRSRELDVALCVPGDWTRSSIRGSGESRHLVQAFSNAQGRAALYLFTLFTARDGGDFERQSIERAWTLMKRLSTSPPNDEAFHAAVDRFQGCDKPIEPNTVLSRVWRSADGLAHVALVVGGAAPGGQACEVLESIGSYYSRDSSQVLGRSR
ncbi:MAG: hypothetical protein IPL75_01325 [Acidobacteria bacterium]|nr:hypothetical protein [Acidobacteriota bacterium]